MESDSLRNKEMSSKKIIVPIIGVKFHIGMQCCNNYLGSGCTVREGLIKKRIFPLGVRENYFFKYNI